MNAFGRLFACILVMLVLSSSTSFAQSYLSIGILGGLNISNASISPYGFSSVSTSSLNGIMAGALLERKLSDIFFVQSELYYIKKGADWKATLFVTPTSYKTTYEYLEVAVLFKLKFGSSSLKPVIFAGPAIGSLISAKQEITVLNNTTSLDWKAVTLSFDAALDFGGGLEFSLSESISIFANGRYSLGFLDVNRSADEWKSNGIQIVGGFMYAL